MRGFFKEGLRARIAEESFHPSLELIEKFIGGLRGELFVKSVVFDLRDERFDFRAQPQPPIVFDYGTSLGILRWLRTKKRHHGAHLTLCPLPLLGFHR